ncbi:MAG TPA: DUF642 domain-containing protein [Acidimicrobiales bacterium]|nr:DUF642 domain-containing protein [Acidimicrobiales bacterium]
MAAVGVLGLILATANVATAQAPVPTGPTPNLLKNGQFAIKGYLNESPIRPGAGGSQIPGWTAGGGGVYLISNTVIAAPKGVGQSVGLEGAGGPGTISQTLKTTPGTTYLLQWYGAGNPGPHPPAVKTMHVLWDNAVVASPTYNTAGRTVTSAGWKLGRAVVTATGPTSTVEFADSMPVGDTYAALVADVTLAGDAELYLPATLSLPRTGKITAVVDSASGSPLSASGVTVKLYGLIKAASYAPTVIQLIASSPVVKGQAVLRLKLAASMVGKTLSAYAVLSGGPYAPVTKKLRLKIT